MTGGGLKGLIAPAIGLGASALLPELAPEFMAGLTESLGATGASALIGAGTGGLSNAVTGGDPLMGALTGGAGGAAGGYLSGLMGPSVPGQEVAKDVATASAPGGASQYAQDLASQQMAGAAGAGAPSSVALPPGAGNVSGAGAATASGGSGIGNWIAKHPMDAVGMGAGILGAFQKPGMNPVNVGGNAQSVQNTSPGFNAPLPKYTYQSTQTPYTGDWYTYGQRPQTPMVQNQLIPQQARGGMVRGYADGGMPLPQHKPSPPPMRRQEPLRQLSVDDVANAFPDRITNSLPFTDTDRMRLMMSHGAGGFLDHARGGLIGYARGGRAHPHAHAQARALGRAVGQHMAQQQPFMGDGQVPGPGGGQDDKVPAMLSKDEFVVPADVTAHLGDGSSEAGGKKLTRMVHNVRAHKATKGFPPKAKANPLAYARA